MRRYGVRWSGSKGTEQGYSYKVRDAMVGYKGYCEKVRGMMVGCKGSGAGTWQ